MAKDKTRRGSPEAIAKRRSARALNTLFQKGAVETAIDGRALKRKKRFLKELAEGKNGEALKAHEALGHVTYLLGMGETLGSIRKLNPKLPPKPALTDEVVQTIRATQESYGFDPRAWRLLGVDIESIMGGGGGESAKPATAPKGRKKGGKRKAA